MSIGNEIAAANKALEPPQAALIIYKQLFEANDSVERMSAANKFIALNVITGGLIEWKRQLLATQSRESDKWKKLYEDAKAELDDVRLRLAILQKEQ